MSKDEASLLLAESLLALDDTYEQSHDFRYFLANHPLIPANDNGEDGCILHPQT
jgi:hypothetical protein